MIVQLIIVWALVILIPILFLLFLKFTSPETPTTTNTTLKDREGYVIKKIKPEDISGKVRILNSSQVWSATADWEIEEGKRVIVNKVEGVHLKVKEPIESDEELIELEGDIDEQEFCPNCETVITVYARECPVCGEELDEKEDKKDEESSRFFDNIAGSLRS